MSRQKKAGCLGVLFDFIMVLLTGGIWFIWIIIRFLRSNS